MNYLCKILLQKRKKNIIVKNKDQKELTKDEKFIIAKKEIDDQISFSGLVKYFKDKAKEKNTKNNISSTLLYSKTNDGNEEDELYYENDDESIVEYQVITAMCNLRLEMQFIKMVLKSIKK